MEKIPKASNVVFLLGAGASAEAGCPTVAKMATEAPKYLRRQQNGIHLSVAYKWLFKQLRKLPHVKKNLAIVDIELVLTALQRLQDRGNDILSVFVSGWRGDVRRHSRYFERLETSLQDYIRMACEVERTKVDYLRPLVRFPTRRPLDVFTLNYDYSIELACQESGVRYTDGFTAYWEPSQFDALEEGIRLHKLHGSLLWYLTARRPRQLVKIPIRGRETDPDLRFFSDDEVLSSLVYPTITKEQHIEPYATLIGRLREALKSPGFLVAVGYSFRDAYIKELVIEKMRENRDLRLIIVSRSPARIVAQSDEMLSGSLSFGEVRDRVYLLPRTTSAALAGSYLAQLISDLDSVYDKLRMLQERWQSIADHERVQGCHNILHKLTELEDFGTVANLFEKDDDGAWHKSALQPSGVESTKALVYSLALIRATPEFRERLSESLNSLFLNCARGAVYESGESSEPVVVGSFGADDRLDKNVARRRVSSPLTAGF